MKILPAKNWQRRASVGRGRVGAGEWPSPPVLQVTASGWEMGTSTGYRERQNITIWSVKLLFAQRVGGLTS